MDLLCDDCRASLRPCPPLTCEPPLDGLAAGLVYEGAAAAGIQAFKYGRRTYLARSFAGRMNVPPDWRVDCVAPVPLHPLKRWRRGFNQSELLAKALAGRYSLPVNTALLRRVKYTRTQTAMRAAERRANVQNAFAASPAAAGLSVLLVDDVTTTHGTLLACADALRRAGAARVYALCACAADQEPAEETPRYF